MRVFDFDHAIVREPACSVIAGLRSDPGAVPELAGVRSEHAVYVAALRKAGLTVDALPPLEQFPDSVFVEDPAIVFPEGAVLLRPGAPTRLGERIEMRGALERHFAQVLELAEGEFADGGDVLVTPDSVLVGLSQRTNAAGAEALVRKLGELGRDAQIVETPRGVLHFKTGVSLLAEDTVLVAPRMAECPALAGFKMIVVCEDEQAAANALRVNDTIFVGAGFARTIDRIVGEGLYVVPLPVTEIGKLDAGLSCMSLRWHSHH